MQDVRVSMDKAYVTSKPKVEAALGGRTAPVMASSTAREEDLLLH